MAKTSKLTMRLETLLYYMTILFLVLIATYFVLEYFHPIIVSGKSMEPTLKNGSLLVSTNTFKEKDLSNGDIIVFEHADVQMIKRIVASPGDEIWIEEGTIYVNDQPSPYQLGQIDESGILSDRIYIKANEYFCIGDNYKNSIDCREFGPIQFEQIKYKILREVKEIKDINDLKNIINFNQKGDENGTEYETENETESEL